MHRSRSVRSLLLAGAALAVSASITVAAPGGLTIAAGKVVWEKGELKVEKGAGKYVDRPCYPPVFDAVKKRNDARQPRAVPRKAAQ